MMCRPPHCQSAAARDDDKANLLLINQYYDGLVQDCGNPSALAMESLQSCAKPSINPSDKDIYIWFPG